MKIPFPTLTLREPITPRPLSGSALGALTGAGFGILGGGTAFAGDWGAEITGFVLGGAVAGIIIGALLPLFRRRLSAGLIVGLAAALGLQIADQSWHEFQSIALVCFLGACVGLTYAVLLWDVKPAEDSSASS